MSRSPGRVIRVFGGATVLFWLSFLPYLPPIAPHPDLGGLIDEIGPWIKEWVPNPELGNAERAAQARMQLRVVYASSFAAIGLGVISGLLLLARRRTGRLLAIALCSLLLIGKTMSLASSGMDVGQRVAQWGLVFEQAPLRLLHGDVLAVGFAIFSVVFLTPEARSRDILRLG